jgi:hypothetical protein
MDQLLSAGMKMASGGGGGGGGDSSPFASAANAIYKQGTPGVPDKDTSDDDVAGAAVSNAFSKFTSSGGQGGQSALVSMAMGEATKLFTARDGQPPSEGFDLKAKITEMVMKYFINKQMGGGDGGGGGGAGAALGMLGALTGGGGGGDSNKSAGGGAGDLLGMAAKFMK